MFFSAARFGRTSNIISSVVPCLGTRSWATSSPCSRLPCSRVFLSPATRAFSTGGLFRSSDPRFGVIVFKLADIGEGITEAKLVEWFVKEGGKIEEMGEVCVVQSDKSAVEISSPYTGTVLKLYHAVDETVKIGSPLITIDVPGEGDEAADNGVASNNAEETKDTARSASEQNKDGTSHASKNPTTAEPAGPPEKGNSKPLASPACRAIAREHGIRLEELTGTGPRGRITKGDVLKHLDHQKSASTVSAPPSSTAHKQPTSPPKAATTQSEEIMLTSPVAKGMVKSMNLSLAIPHMSLQEDVDITELLLARTRMNKFLEQAAPGEKLTITTLIIKSISTALKTVPIMNSKFDVTRQDRYTLYHHHNISIAIDTPHGLVVPNIKNVEKLTLREIQKELLQLQTLANANRLTPAHLTGGTITVSNVGVIGGTAVRPILFDGQATILGLGRNQKLPRFNASTNAFDARDIMNITASVDHRHVDGATVARFIKTLRAVMENVHTLAL